MLHWAEYVPNALTMKSFKTKDVLALSYSSTKYATEFAQSVLGKCLLTSRLH